jgi:hypothetical protein
MHAMPADQTMRGPLMLAWAWTAALSALDIGWVIALGYSVPGKPLFASVGAGVLLLCVSAIYRYARPDPIISILAEAGAFLVLFTMALATSSYLAFTLNFPLRDEAFAAMDRAVHFDFIAHIAFVAAHPTFAKIINLCYLSSLPQIVVVVLALGATRRHARLRTYLALFALTASSVILVSGLFPSLGTYPFYNVPDDLLPAFTDPRMGLDHVPHILAMRDGSMQRIPLDDMRGLVAFPSFHTALAVITIWALMDIRWLALPAFVLNGLLILGTPTNGSHYLADVIAGAFIAFGALALLTGRRQMAQSPTPAGLAQQPI